MSQFCINENKGFKMTFENGWTISVQFGYGNYCQNYHHPNGFNFGKNQELVTSTNAEIAIWDKDGKWYNFGSDTVKGYCSVNEVAKWIERVSKF